MLEADDGGTMDTRLGAVRASAGLLALFVAGAASAAESSRPDRVQPAAPPSQNQTPGSQETPPQFTQPQSPPPPKTPVPVTQQPPTQPQPRPQMPRPLAPPAPVTASPLDPSPLPVPSTSVAPAPLPSPTTPFVPVPLTPGPFNNPASAGRPFITDLEGNRQAAEQRFNAQMQERRRTFEQRQKDDEAAFGPTAEGTGFFERRRLWKEFRAEQKRKRKAFNDEEDARRKKTEWRFE